MTEREQAVLEAARKWREITAKAGEPWCPCVRCSLALAVADWQAEQAQQKGE